MKPILQAGMAIVILALTSYSIAIFTAQRLRKATKRVLVFITLGVALDITATACMVIGSDRAWNEITLHAALGYSSLTGMLIDMILIWRHKLSEGDSPLANWLHQYSRYAYIWWVLAFITGGMLVAMR
jgi:hypothetical protein